MAPATILSPIVEESWRHPDLKTKLLMKCYRSVSLLSSLKKFSPLRCHSDLKTKPELIAHQELPTDDFGVFFRKILQRAILTKLQCCEEFQRINIKISRLIEDENDFVISKMMKMFENDSKSTTVLFIRWPMKDTLNSSKKIFSGPTLWHSPRFEILTRAQRC